MDEEIEQNPLFDDLPELDDVLEQYNSAQEREIIDPEDRSEFEPTEAELMQDEAFLPNVHLEPLAVEELNGMLDDTGLPQIEIVPDMLDGRILLIPTHSDNPNDAVVIDWTKPEPSETDLQYSQKIDQLRDEALDHLADQSNLPPDLIAEQLADEGAPTPGTLEYRIWMGYSAEDPILQAREDGKDAWICACGKDWLIADMSVDDDLQLKFCSNCGLTGAESQEIAQKKRESLKDSPIPTDKALSADELIAIANAALDKLQGEKRAQKLDKYRERMSRGADLRHPVNTPDYVQARIIEGGCGEPDCPMCLGNTCRFCGFGCWDPKGAPTCTHNIQTRHIWDATKEEYRKGLIEAELIALGMTSEIRRLEMLAKIFDGEPNKGGSNDYCYKCNKPIGMGVLVVTTSRGRYHYDCPTTIIDAGEVRSDSSQDSPEETR